MTSAAASIDVSVIIPTWRAADTVEAAVASALASRDVGVEVVVVDDASPDQTFDVLTSLAQADPRVRVDRLLTNGGPSGARNRALELARGRFIAVLDADDTIAPGRLSNLIQRAEAADADIIVDNMIEVDERGEKLGLTPFLSSEAFARPRDIDLSTWVRFNRPMRGSVCLGFLKPVIRRSTLAAAEVRYDPALRNSEDYYLIAHLLALHARMIYAPTAEYCYRRAAGSTSHRLTPAQTKAWLIAEAGFRNRFERQFSADERAELDIRGRILREVDQFVAALDLVKARRFAAFAGLLAADPAAAGFTLSSFAKIAVGKAAGVKLV